MWLLWFSFYFGKVEFVTTLNYKQLLSIKLNLLTYKINGMIKVFIVDDHEIIREGLKKILKEESDLIVVGEAQSGDEVL